MSTCFTFFAPASRLGSRSAALLGAVVLLCGSFGASAQIYSKTQDFSGTAVTPSSYVTATTAASGTNAATAGYFSTDFVQGGFGAFGAEDNNASITPNTIPVVFATQVFQANSTGNKLTFQLGQRAVNGNNGFDDHNFVTVNISLNGGAAVTALTVDGLAGNGISFNIGTGSTGTSSYASPVTITEGGVGPQNPTGGAVGTFTVTLPNFTDRTTVAATITITAAKKSTVLIDNVTISSSAPLPVELTRFEATAKGTGVSLTWATASEKNNDRFEVQRSATGEAFQTVGTVKGQGNSTAPHAYAFFDAKPLAGLSYYRLRQVDLDGTESFSPVRAVPAAGRLDALVFPNPSAGSVTLPAGLGPVQYRILNTLGQSVCSGQAQGNDRLDLTTLTPGTFFLELTGEAGRNTQRLVRQ